MVFVILSAIDVHYNAVFNLILSLLKSDLKKKQINRQKVILLFSIMISSSAPLDESLLSIFLHLYLTYLCKRILLQKLRDEMFLYTISSSVKNVAQEMLKIEVTSWADSTFMYSSLTYEASFPTVHCFLLLLLVLCIISIQHTLYSIIQY